MEKLTLNRLKLQEEKIIADFRAWRSTTEQIFNLQILGEKYLQHQLDLCHVFNRVFHAALWATMKKYNISTNFIQVIKNLYDNAGSAIVFNSNIGDWFRTTVGVLTGMSTHTHPFQHISGKDHDRRHRKSQRYCQHWRLSGHQFPFCWWHWWLN